MAGDTVARSVNKFIYIRIGGQILWIYPPLNKPKPLVAMRLWTRNPIIERMKKYLTILYLTLPTLCFGQHSLFVDMTQSLLHSKQFMS